VVCEGFIRWSISPALRRLLTRLLGLIPSLIVAVAIGREGIDALLVVSQVVLSVCLPFITLPLLWLTSNTRVMTVRRRPDDGFEQESDSGKVNREDADTGENPVSFANGKAVIAIGATIWLLVAVANVYVLVKLGLGEAT
jgi:metal iron transporter